jgi:hypothetical protein
MGTGTHRRTPVIKRTLGIAAVFAVGVTALAHNSVERLEEATARQCITHDWPESQHQTHVDWCHDNGYQVGKLGPRY